MEIFLLFGMVIGLMLIGVPIAMSLGLSSILFLLWFSDSFMASIAGTLFEAFEGHFTLSCHPVLHSGLILHVHRRRCPGYH